MFIPPPLHLPGRRQSKTREIVEIELDQMRRGVLK
jgi:hypothetical protein